MKRRQFLPAMAGLAGITALDWVRSRPANATFLNDLIDGAMGSPSSSVAPDAAVYSEGASMFSEIYGANYIGREQLERLRSGTATHWYDIASKPYARIRSDDGYEHYYFPFNFGQGGVTIISDSSGAIASWDIMTADLVPQFSPADLSEYNYYPPKAEVVSSTPQTDSQVPPMPAQQAPLGCH